MLVVVLAASVFSIQAYLGGIRDGIETANNQVQTKGVALEEITKETAKYDQLDQDIVKLNQKLMALKNITVSKISKYKSVILLEQLQNLKPEGVWFNYIGDNTAGNKLTIVGKSFDNILVAEFMTALSATKTQDLDESDLRTQIYFEEIRLERISTSGATSSLSTVPAAQILSPMPAPLAAQAPASGQTPASGQPAVPAPIPSRLTALPEEVAENVSGHWTSTDSIFPELGKFPSFHLTLVYKERLTAPNPAKILSN